MDQGVSRRQGESVLIVMSATRPYRRPALFIGDYRRFGAVSLHPVRDQSDGSVRYRVGWISGGGDLHFTSRMPLERGEAVAAGNVLAEFVSAEVKELDP